MSDTSGGHETRPYPGLPKVMMQLMKLRVIVLLQITALCAILVHDTLARYGVIDLQRTWSDTLMVACITVVGGTLSAGGSNAINMWYDADIDPHMRRTMNRPIPLGHATPGFALIFGSTIAIIGSALFLLLSVKAAFWSAFSVVFYVLVYSIWLKRRTPQTIVIGGIAGSTPPLIGWAAAAGDSIANSNPMDLGSPIPWMLFFLIFLWTPPHFWALALAKKDEYAAAKIPMLPVTHGDNFTRIHITLYTLMMSVCSFLPFLIGFSGKFYLFGSIVLNLFFLYLTISMQISKSNNLSFKIFNYSIIYLSALFGFMIADRYLNLLVIL